MNYYSHKFGRADLRDLKTLLSWLADHDDERLRTFAGEVMAALDGSDLEMGAWQWKQLHDAIEVFIGHHCNASLKGGLEISRRMFAIAGVIRDVLAREPSRTVEVSRPAETCDLETVGSVQGSLFDA